MHWRFMLSLKAVSSCMEVISFLCTDGEDKFYMPRKDHYNVYNKRIQDAESSMAQKLFRCASGLTL